MRLIRERPVKFFVLLVGACAVVVTTLPVWHQKDDSQPVNPNRATYADKSLGFRVSLPSPWVALSASEAAMITSEGRTALAESGESKMLRSAHADGKTRVLTAMNPETGDSFQILKQEELSSVDGSKPEIIANDLRSTFLSLLPMQTLGPVECLYAGKPVAHFNGILTVRGAPIYQSIFVAVTKGTAITFVFSGPADTVLDESKRSFPEWVSFDHVPVP